MTLQFTRIVADENIPQEVVQVLKDMGFKEVYSIQENRPGIADPEVWRLAAAKHAVLLTGDTGFLPQLDEGDVLQGPAVIEYSTSGFSRNELQDPEVMSHIIKWLFQNNHHHGREYVKVLIDGTERTHRQLWGHEKTRRKRQP